MADRTKIAALCVGLFGVSLARAVAPDVLPLQWPAAQYKRDLVAFLGCSILPVHQTDHRLTVEERLQKPPFVSDSTRVGLDLSTLDQAAAQKLRAAAQNDVLSFDAFLPPAEKLYVERRYFLGQLSHLKKHLGIGTDPLWQSVDVISLITRGKRRIWFHVQKVLTGALAGLERGGPTTYLPETWFVAEDLSTRGESIETHVTAKRSDWEWDYAIYDRNGAVTGTSAIDPDGMRVPSMCFACHRSTGRIPPFSTWPEPSPDFNGVKPEVQWPLTTREEQIVRAFSGRGMAPGDDVMGNYAGIAALRFRQMMAQPGPHPEWMQPLWDRLVKRVPLLAQ